MCTTPAGLSCDGDGERHARRVNNAGNVIRSGRIPGGRRPALSWLEGFPTRPAKVRRSSLRAGGAVLPNHQDLWSAGRRIIGEGDDSSLVDGDSILLDVVAPIITVWLLSAAPEPLLFVEFVVVPQAASSKTSAADPSRRTKRFIVTNSYFLIACLTVDSRPIV